VMATAADASDLNVSAIDISTNSAAS
jgi:hypothetical protein